MSGLNQKPTASQEIQWDKYGESDLSDEGDDKKSFKGNKAAPGSGGGGSKFLKKKTPAKQDENIDKGNVSNKTKAKDAGSTKKPSSAASQQKGATQTKSSALTKVAAFTNRYESKGARDVAPLSESDMDLSLSMDDDVLRDVQNLRAVKGSGGCNDS